MAVWHTSVCWLSQTITNTTFFPGPHSTFLTCFIKGERRKYVGKIFSLKRVSNWQNHQIMSPTRSPLSRPDQWGLWQWKSLQQNSFLYKCWSLFQPLLCEKAASDLAKLLREENKKLQKSINSCIGNSHVTPIILQKTVKHHAIYQFFILMLCKSIVSFNHYENKGAFQTTGGKAENIIDLHYLLSPPCFQKSSLSRSP